MSAVEIGSGKILIVKAQIRWGKKKSKIVPLVDIQLRWDAQGMLVNLKAHMNVFNRYKDYFLSGSEQSVTANSVPVMESPAKQLCRALQQITWRLYG